MDDYDGVMDRDQDPLWRTDEGIYGRKDVIQGGRGTNAYAGDFTGLKREGYCQNHCMLIDIRRRVIMELFDCCTAAREHQIGTLAVVVVLMPVIVSLEQKTFRDMSGPILLFLALFHDGKKNSTLW